MCGGLYEHQLAATIGKYVLDPELVCTVLEPEDMRNRIEYLPFAYPGRRLALGHFS